jgi:anion-transporting  ArsA/GET3 family ATPase
MSELGGARATPPDASRGRGTPAKPVRLDLDRIIDDRRTRIIVCCGSGGVGKTTAAASIGLRAAERGRQACVLTVDPARRLAQSMGLTSLDNTPRRVDGVDTANGGSLHAMMLDMKRTFDEIVEAHADPDRAAQILANPFYQSLSSSFAGTQEYMAMEKLGQLRHAEEWDLIVVDTPPSRSALDFLDAPQRLGRFLDGKLIRLLTVPAKAGMSYMKVLNAGFAMMTSALTKILGAQVLKDAQTFVTAFDTMFGGFRERAEGTYRLLQAPGTAFLVVAAPEPDALREASYFVERLDTERMPLAGLILNRVHTSPASRLSAARSLAAAETLDMQDRPDGPEGNGPRYSIAAAALRLHAERMQLSKRERRLAEHFTSAHPAIPVAEVVAQPEDVHDLEGLRVMGAILPRPGRNARPGQHKNPVIRKASRRGLATLLSRPLSDAAQLATSSSIDCRSYSSRARSSSSRQEVTSGRRRSSARRSRSVIPPQTPNSIPLSSASARHSVRTGQPRQISLARFCAAPWTNSSSGSVPLHAARVVQSVIHMCPLLLIVEHERPTVVSMGLRFRGQCVRPP